jgi:hypothetical protein
VALDLVKERNLICQEVLSGDIASAIKRTEALAPKVSTISDPKMNL